MTRYRGMLMGAALLIAVVGACGGGSRGIPEESIDAVAPVAVVADSFISDISRDETFFKPYGLAVDFRGSLYVSDEGSHRLVAFSPQLEQRYVAGGQGGTPGLLNRPGFISVDNGLTVIVADRGNTRLCRYNSRLEYVDEIDLLDAEDLARFGQPSGVAINDFGETWMADSDKDRVALFDNTDRFDRFIAEFGYSGGMVSDPQKIARDGRGGFLICDAGNGRVLRFDRFGSFSGAIGEDVLVRPIAATVDQSLRVWVIDHEVPGLFCFDRRGKLLFENRGSMTGLDHSFASMNDIAVLSDGRLVFSDSRLGSLVVARMLTIDE